MITKRNKSITDTLKRAIENSGQSIRGIATATNVQRASLIRFMRGDQSIRLDVADKLAEYFGIECRVKGK